MVRPDRQPGRGAPGRAGKRRRHDGRPVPGRPAAAAAPGKPAGGASAAGGPERKIPVCAEPLLPAQRHQGDARLGQMAGDIPLLIDEVVKNKADIFAFARYCPSKEDRDTCCLPEEYHDMMEQCWQKFQKYEGEGCKTTFNLKDHLWTLFQYEKGIFDPKAYPDDEYVYDGCNCGNCHLTILSDGAVYACRRMESKVGNALTDDLYDLFTGPEFDKYRVYENFEKCSKCELLRFCRGCPAVAAGYHGNMYAPDPQCWKEIKE